MFLGILVDFKGIPKYYISKLMWFLPNLVLPSVKRKIYKTLFQANLRGLLREQVATALCHDIEILNKLI